MKKLKVCQINCLYGIGSTGKITRDIHKSLDKKGIDSIVIVPGKNQFTHEKGVFTVSNIFLSYVNAVLRRTLGMQFDWAHLQTWRIIRILKLQKPDVVHLHCINGNDINIYMLESYLAANNIKTLYTLHAEFPYTGGCGHAYDCEKWKDGCGNCPIFKEATQSPFIDGTHRTWRKQKKCYEKFNNNDLTFIAVSPWLLNRAAQAPLLADFRKVVVMNGVDTDVFCFRQPQNVWRKRLGIGKDEMVLLHVAASFYPHSIDLKGGRFILELAERLKTMPIKIVVASNYGEGQNLPDNVVFVGRCETQQDLAELYREARLTIITSKRETFSMPVAESLCSGTPIVGFKAGGPESIAIADYSEFVEYGDMDAYQSAILKWINKSFNREELAARASAMFSKDVMTLNYCHQYQDLYNELS